MVAPKREKMVCQRSMTQKKEEEEKREKGVAMSQERERETGMIRERKPLPQGVSHIHPFIH